MLGHLSFKPSSQRIYSNSAMGDLRVGSASVAKGGSDVEGNPLISCSSVTTSPLEVISLFLTIRLCGNKAREVLMHCFTALFLRTNIPQLEMEGRSRKPVMKKQTHSLTPASISTIRL